VEGITGVDASTLASGQTVTVNQLAFGQGTNPFMTSAPGRIFVTDVPATTPGEQLLQMGVFQQKQAFAIQFSQETALENEVRPFMEKQNIFTIPGGTFMQGTFQILVR
jgi:hypothetical protein